MEYRILGALEVRADGASIALGPPKQRTVLAVLLLHAGEIVPTDRLIELAWGGRPPRTASHSIQIYISELRKALEHDGGGPVISTTPPGYTLRADAESIDARRFERLLTLAAHALEAGDPSAAAARTREALGLWRGPPLSDFAYDEFAQDEIRRLEMLHLDALEQLAAGELALGREHAAISSIEAALAEDPLRERSREIQMLALYRAGRRADALRAYEWYRELLSSELGVEPTTALRRLQERVLLHDPSIGPVASVEVVPTQGTIRNPYKGLRAFGEDDAGDFFGREGLVADLVTALARGTRLLALVGPSGSGKSSVIHAGLLPALRLHGPAGQEGWRIARMTPGERPFEALGTALRQAVPDAPRQPTEPPGATDDSIRRAAGDILPERARLLLVIDQFEELFSLGDEPTRLRFLNSLASAVDDPGGEVTAVLALRADFYDRPLLHPGFATVFIPGVVNVVPMGPDDLEAAVVGPADRVGIAVDPALLAQLMADAADQPGALPLLEYALTELFDRRATATLTLEAYRAMGGLREALSRRAEELYTGLAGDRRQAAMQVLLRLVKVGDGAGHSRRRVPLHELTGLGLDPVALSEVLDSFGRGRLLTFDRDPGSLDATVEVAHEALLTEWARLAGWIDRHRADLRQHDALTVAAGEWASSGRDPDYLPIGTRLAEYEAWSRATALQFTALEREFMGAGVARRHAEESELEARRERQRQLERRARTRLWGMLGAIAALAAAATFGVLTWLGSGPPDVVMVFEGTGDAGFGDMAAEGFEGAVAEFGLDADTQVVMAGTREVETKLRELSDEGVDLVVVGIGSFAAQATAAVAADHPDTRYVAWESELDLPNVTDIAFRSEEAAYLAGAAAALTSRTGTIGFIGAFRHPIIDTYLAGYQAGARSVPRDVEVLSSYLAELPDYSGIDSRELGARAADALYSDGADVILAVGSGLGAVQAAHAASEASGRQLWVIGVDSDAYLSVRDVTLPDGIAPADWQEHILTSVTKRLDTALRAVLTDYARGSLDPGARSFGLREHGVGITYSGGYLDDVLPGLEELRRLIESGVIRVPNVPEP